MRAFFTIISLALVASMVAATSTVPREVDASSIPETCLATNTAGTSFATFPCSGDIPPGMSAAPVSGRWNASHADLGWDYLEVKIGSVGGWGKKDWGFAGYHMGVLEGMLTADRIDYVVSWSNRTLGASTEQWIRKHMAYMKDKAAAYVARHPERNNFWPTVGRILEQIRGLKDGYNAVKGTNYSDFDFFLLSFGSEVGDVDIAVNLQEGKLDKSELLPPRKEGSHCSALIKPTHDDLFMAHDTWSGFGSMGLRIFKVYRSNNPALSVSFSSYPASVASGDDWYQISDGRDRTLAVQETTNEVFNTSLYVNVVPHTVSEFIRVMAANYLAKDGEEWTNYFATENSGTYNNQYMVVDFSKYIPGASILPDTLWIAEQIPGFVQRGDVSSFIAEHGYWASYNIPYFWNIYEMSGYTEMEKRQGSFWSYSKYARPEIFKRNHTDVHSIATMMRMMRYNNYKEDPLSVIPNCTGTTGGMCSPKHSSMLSIASRGDLMKVYATKTENVAHYGPLYGFVAQGCFGAVDSKIASWKNRHNLNSWAINGPTNDQVPTFSFGGANCPHAPPSSPTTFDFPWLEFKNEMKN